MIIDHLLIKFTILNLMLIMPCASLNSDPEKTRPGFISRFA